MVERPMTRAVKSDIIDHRLSGQLGLALSPEVHDPHAVCRSQAEAQMGVHGRQTER